MHSTNEVMCLISIDDVLIGSGNSKDAKIRTLKQDVIIYSATVDCGFVEAFYAKETWNARWFQKSEGGSFWTPAA
uniref:Uncharacterized protein n=1 Tax=Romanomermis culicivorax TaxID=13658 RepID=A0A915KQ46_ROMCU